MQFCVSVLCLALALFLGGCAPTHPYHVIAKTPVDGSCDEYFSKTDCYDAKDSNDLTEHFPSGDEINNSCWQSAWEHHESYDLFFTEFDDQGWENNAQMQGESQIRFLMDHLKNLMDGKDGPQTEPLNIVVFVHGWHHTASGDDLIDPAFANLKFSQDVL